MSLGLYPLAGMTLTLTLCLLSFTDALTTTSTGTTSLHDFTILNRNPSISLQRQSQRQRYPRTSLYLFNFFSGNKSSDNKAPGGGTSGIVTNSNMYNVPPFYDGTSDSGLINQAKRLLQSDMGLNDPSLLDDSRFVWIGPYVDAPLSKIDYITAGRFFNLRAAFPDLDYRAYDFRISSNTGGSSGSEGTVTVRCTCRVTGTMRGELRLRSAILPPTGVTMRCPPEAISITLDKSTGQVLRLCSGFALDRLVGNTQGTTGVQAASIMAGEQVSAWDLFPPLKVLANVFARPAKPIVEKSTFLSPFPETVMIQLAKGVIASSMAAEDPTLLSDDFTFCTPIVGPIRKALFLEKYAKNELDGVDPNFSNYRNDPFDPARVWVDLSPSAVGFQGPPQAMSFTFDEDGYCTRVTSGAVMDPLVGNAGGLGGPDGYRYATGRASPGIASRPLPRALGRLQRRILSPFTGVSIDSLPAPLATTVRKPATGMIATPVRPKLPPPLSISRMTMDMKPKETKVDPKVVSRLEQLKDLASSIRISPTSMSVPILPSISTPSNNQKAVTPANAVVEREKRLAAAQKATADAQETIARAKREAALISQQQAAAKAKQQAVEEKKQLSSAAAQKQAQQKAKQQADLEERRKAQLAEVEKKRRESERQRAADVAFKQAAANQKQREMESRRAEAEKQKAQKTREREQEVKRTTATAAAKAKQNEIEQGRREAEQQRAEEQKKRQVEAQRAAAVTIQKEAERQRKIAVAEQKAEMEIKKQEAEAQRAAAQAASETKKLQFAKSQQLEQQRRETAAKAKLAAVATKSSDRLKAGQKLPPPKASSSLSLVSQEWQPLMLAQATISLFGLGNKELDDLPAAKASSPKKAPMGVPTVKRWRKNSDSSISGLVYSSRSFDDGSRITTSPIASGTFSSGEVVKTGSGSRYFLE